MTSKTTLGYEMDAIGAITVLYLNKGNDNMRFHVRSQDKEHARGLIVSGPLAFPLLTIDYEKKDDLPKLTFSNFLVDGYDSILEDVGEKCKQVLGSDLEVMLMYGKTYDRNAA